MSIKVLKFGGSSQSKNTYEMIYDTIKNDSNNKYIIVLSAIKGVTNSLLKFTESKNFSEWNKIIEVNKELSIETIGESISFINTIENKLWDLELDTIEIIAMGEFFTTNILNDYLISKDIKSTFISSFDVIKSNLPNNGLYNKGEFIVDAQKIITAFQDNNVIIIPGFSGYSSDNKPCLLGRGGSDTTGSILASAINASIYEIWTDVNGLYSSDPRIINDTFIIPHITYNVSQEIAAMGAKIIHPFCILPCAEKNIPIVIKNTFEPNAKVNTIISNFQNYSRYNNLFAITLQKNVTVFKITSINMWNNFGFVYDIFSIFKKYNVDVNIINTSQFNITTTTEDINITNLFCVKEELEKKYNVELEFDNTIISVIGDNIKSNYKIGEMFNMCRNYNIIMTSYSSNDMTISWVLKDKTNEFAQELHNYIFNINTKNMPNFEDGIFGC